MRIDQWTPDLRRGDAIGDSILRLRDRFRAWGHRSEGFSLTLSQNVAGEARAFVDWTPSGPEDVVILHYALASPLTAALAEQPGRRVLIHHNVTPAEFYADWDPELARICREGREQVASLRDHVDLALGDSEFNRRELEQMGFARTGVLPIYLDFGGSLGHKPPVTSPAGTGVARDGQRPAGRVAHNRPR